MHFTCEAINHIPRGRHSFHIPVNKLPHALWAMKRDIPNKTVEHPLEHLWIHRRNCWRTTTYHKWATQFSLIMNFWGWNFLPTDETIRDPTTHMNFMGENSNTSNTWFEKWIFKNYCFCSSQTTKWRQEPPLEESFSADIFFALFAAHFKVSGALQHQSGCISRPNMTLKFVETSIHQSINNRGVLIWIVHGSRNKYTRNWQFPTTAEAGHIKFHPKIPTNSDPSTNAIKIFKFPQDRDKLPTDSPTERGLNPRKQKLQRSRGEGSVIFARTNWGRERREIGGRTLASRTFVRARHPLPQLLLSPKLKAEKIK